MESQIRNALRDLVLPGTTVEALSLLEHLTIDTTKVFLLFHLPENFKKLSDAWEQAIKRECESICDLPIMVTFHRHKKESPPSISGINGVQHVIAVASGKGGVGKSSICLNLALALQRQGLKVGVLDADIYGPSLPTMTGIFAKPLVTDEKKLIPQQKFGLKLMSMGFMVPKDAAIIWRGLMVQSAIGQMLNDVVWDHDGKQVDVLMIDLPPGTGDAQLTIAQKANLSGAVIVATSQELALIDARRAVKMFEKVNIPVLGMIENMSNFVCQSCGVAAHLFPEDGVGKECLEQNLPLLGVMPFDVTFRASADAGQPFFLQYPEHQLSNTLSEIATAVRSQMTTS